MGFLDEISEKRKGFVSHHANQVDSSANINQPSVAQNNIVTSSGEDQKKVEKPRAIFPAFIKNLSIKKLFIVVLITLLVLAVGTLSYLYWREKNTTNLGVGSDVAQAISIKVSKLARVPTDEIPAVATISDVSKLKEKNPTFYKDAKNGDKLLVYTDRVVLYDDTNNLILNMTTFDKNSAPTTPSGDVAGESNTKK